MSQAEQRLSGTYLVTDNNKKEGDAAAPVAQQRKDLEGSYQRHAQVAQQSKREYEDVYCQLVAKLSSSQLEPFNKILLEREQCSIHGQDQLIEVIRQKLQNTLDKFWDGSDVTNGLTCLEMLKEKYKELEGTDWNIESKNPHQLVRNLRMRFKETRLRYLRKQLEFQAAELAEIQKSNGMHRALISEVEQQRRYLKEKMEHCSERFTSAKPQLQQMTEEVLLATSSGK